MQAFAALCISMAAVGLARGDDETSAFVALRGLDPVELVVGKETPGKPALAVTLGKYRYPFASPATMKQFETDPARYGIQMGGACGRMGLLSGLGDPDRYLVARSMVFTSRSRWRALLTGAPSTTKRERQPLRTLTSADFPPARFPSAGSSASCSTPPCQ